MYLVVSPTDITYAIFSLFNKEMLINTKKINGAPEEFLAHLLKYLEEQGVSVINLEGVIVVTGPGSATSLRAGLAVINTFAFVHKLPLIPVANAEDKILKELISNIDLNKTVAFVTPEYGREPNITKSQKTK